MGKREWERESGRERDAEEEEGKIETDRERDKQTDDNVGKQTPFICMQQPIALSLPPSTLPLSPLPPLSALLAATTAAVTAANKASC